MLRIDQYKALLLPSRLEFRHNFYHRMSFVPDLEVMRLSKVAGIELERWL